MLVYNQNGKQTHFFTALYESISYIMHVTVI